MNLLQLALETATWIKLYVISETWENEFWVDKRKT